MTTCIPRKSPTLSSFVPLGPSAGSKLPASDPNTICCLLLHVSGDVDAYGIPQAGLRRPCPTYLVRSPQRGYGRPIISSRSPVHPINIFPHGGVPSVHMTLRAQRNHHSPDVQTVGTNLPIRSTVSVPTLAEPSQCLTPLRLSHL